MKRISLVLVALLVLTAFVSAQNTGITSVVNDSSQGLFNNPLDNAANVGSGFDELENSYLFAGVSNIEKLVSDPGVYTWDGSGTPEMNPMWMGFYNGKGGLPWSLFLGFDAAASAGNQSDGTSFTQGAFFDEVVGTTTTRHQWNDFESTVEYTANRLLNEFNGTAQFLTVFGGINTGLYFNYYVDDNSNQALNKKVSETYYYDASLGLAVPVATVDYSFDQTQTSTNKNTWFELGVPLFMETGDMSHTANLSFGNLSIDNSSTDVQTISGTPFNPLAFAQNVEQDDVVDLVSMMMFDVNYALALPALVGSHEDNALNVDLNVNFGIEKVEYSDALTTQNVSYTGGGAAVTLGARNDDTNEDVYNNAVDMTFGLNAGHSFYYDLGPATFAFSPSLGFSYEKDAEVEMASETNVDRFDGDGDGAFTTAADIITTTTVTYTNTNSAGGNLATDTILTTTFTLPVALKVTPEKWPFSLTLGSTPQLQLVNTITETLTSTSSTTASGVDGTGADLGTNITNAVSSEDRKVTSSDLNITATHNLGLSVPVGDYVSLDVDLGLSTTSESIFDFNDLVIQATVALP